MKCPQKIAKMTANWYDKKVRDVLDILLRDDGTMRGLNGKWSKHRPLSVKQVSWIMLEVFGVHLSRQTLYKYLSYLESNSESIST